MIGNLGKKKTTYLMKAERKGTLMDDASIVALYWQRSPHATEETARKYGIMLRGMAYRLLRNPQDSEECVNDTYFAAWNGMPTDRPEHLGAYLARILRNLSIDRLRRDHRAKRGGAELLIEELTECIPSREGDVEATLENERLKEALNRFLASLDRERRVVFLRRYFYGDPINEIAARMGWSESRVKTALFRLRAGLRALLEKAELL